MKKNTCVDVLLADPIVLRPDSTLGEAFHAIQSIRVAYLPVVAEDGRFVGVFSWTSLLSLFLPGSAVAGLKRKQLALNFMDTSLEELREQLDGYGGRHLDDRVEHYAQTEGVPICAPSTSLMEVIQLMYGSFTYVIVVDSLTRKFVGVVTVRSLLDLLMPAA